MSAVAIGPRVFLRPPTSRDGEELTRLYRASIRFHRRLASPPRTPQQFAAYLERCRQPGYESLLVCRREDGAIVGRLNVSEIVRGNLRSAYLGYEVGAAFAGQGYMTQALPLLLRHAFGPLRLHRLEANIQPGNAASIALVRRAGFTREGFSRRYLKIGGRWRDHERWAILVEDWRGGAARRGERRRRDWRAGADKTSRRPRETGAAVGRKQTVGRV